MNHLIRILLFVSILTACSESDQKIMNLTNEILLDQKKARQRKRAEDKSKQQKLKQEGRRELNAHLKPFLEDKVVTQFPSVDFEYAVVYETNPSVRNIEAVFLGRTGKSKFLSKEEANRFNKIINSSKTYGDSPAACFDPRIGLVYYNKDSIPTAHITICFECHQSYAYPKIKGQQMHITETSYRAGLSETGAVNLKYLFAEWGFPNTNFNPMMGGEKTIKYLEDILPTVMEEEEAKKTIEDYKNLLEDHK